MPEVVRKSGRRPRRRGRCCPGRPPRPAVPATSPHLPPKAVHALAGASRIRHYGGAQGNPSEVRDCHQSKQSILLRLLLAADLRVCAPGRTRTCTLRMRSKATAVHLMSPWAIAAGRSESPCGQWHRERLCDDERIAIGIASPRPLKDSKPSVCGQKLRSSRARRVASFQVGATMMRRMVHRGPVGSIGPTSWNAATYPACRSLGNAARVQRPYG
jgi:hypothetical protein